MRCIIVVLFSLFALQVSVAQSRNGGMVQGIVIDSTTRQVLREAPVSLLTAKDSSLVTYTITGGEGNFIFRNVLEGNYRVLVTFLGYRNLSKLVSVTKAYPLADCGTLEMVQTPIMLKEVVVEQERAPVTIKSDTLEFNAQSFKTRPNAQVEELLKKLPGIEISRDGTIKAQGEEVKKVLVDGKPFFGDDPKVATRNLPAEIIDKVQLFNQQSDQANFSGFDDGTPEKTINLTTKKDKRKGTFGQNSIGIGSQNRYQARLNVNRFNNQQQLSILGLANNVNQQGFTIQDMFNFGSGLQGGNTGSGDASGPMMGGPALMLLGRGPGNTNGNASGGTANNITESWAGGANYRDIWGKKVEVNGSYFLNHSNVTTAQTSRRRNILPDSSYTNDRENVSQNQSTSHRFNFRLDYQIDSLNSLRITPNINVQHAAYTGTSDAKAFTDNEIPLNSSTTQNASSGDGINGSNYLLYMRKFNKRGRTFSLNLNTVLSQQNSLATNRSSNYFYGESGSQPASRIVDQQNKQHTRTLNNTLTLSYTEPLSLRHTLEMHYAYGSNGNQSNREVNDYDESSGKYEKYNAPLCNNFANLFSTQRAGMHFQTKRLKYTYSVGLDVQRTDLRNTNETSDSQLNRYFTNVLPNALFTYNFSNNRTLRINYRSRINAPTVSQLQPVADNSNPLNIRLGNPALKPEYINNIMAMYNFFHPTSFRSLFAVLQISQTGNKIVNATVFNNVGAQTTRPVNSAGNYQVNGFMAIGRPIRPIKANMNLTTTLNFNRGISFVNEQSNYSRSFTVGQGLSLNSNFNEKFEYNIGGNINYQTAAYSLQSQQNTAFLYKTLTLDLYYQLPLRLVFTTELTYNNNTGRSAGYNQSFILWNAAIARQFFKNKQGELKFQVYDLLNQNRSIVRNVGDTYVEDVQSRVLKQYFMLSFMYNIRKFGGNHGMAPDRHMPMIMPRR